MNYFWISINQKEQDRFLLKCYKQNIVIYESVTSSKRCLFKIAAADYPKVSKMYFAKVRVEDATGTPKIKKFLKKYFFFIISSLLGLFLFFFLTHIIVKVEVIHSNKDIRDLLTTALAEKGIKKNTWKKSFSELEQIKKEILNQYPDRLEWLEIETQGMNYYVRVEERKLKEEEQKMERCHLVATKDGILKKLIYSKGEALLKTNDYVKKGDIIVTGILKKDEETKEVLCASGKAYAEVWYKATIKVPKKRMESKETGKIRWNILLKNNSYNDFLFRSRLENYQTETKSLFKIFNTEVFFAKQKEVVNTIIEKNEAELLDEATTKMQEKIKLTLQEDEEILNQKILSQNETDDYLEVQFFVAVLEQIGKQQEFTLDSDLDTHSPNLSE